MRLIDADALMETIRAHEYPLRSYFNSTDNGMFTIGIQQAVDEQPTVDAVERKKGKWIKISITDDGYAINYRCSCCKGDDVKYPWKYCPNCGADMRGEAND